MRNWRSNTAKVFSTKIVQAFVDVLEPAMLWFVPDRRWVAVETDGEELVFYAVAKGKAKLLGISATLSDRDRRALRPGRHANLELRLASSQVIESVLKIPAEGAPFIASIVESRLDRLTPWKPEKLIYGFAPASRPKSGEQIDVLFAATSRDIATASLTRLAAAGFTPLRVGSASEPIEQGVRVDLLRGENDTARTRWRRSIAAGSVAVLALLVCSVCATTYLAIATADRLAETQDAMNRLRARIAGGPGTAADRQRQTDIVSEKNPARAAFVLIDRLSTIIPATTYLVALDIDTTTVRMSGVSSEAAALVPILEQEGGFSDATFTAPVVRQEDGLDRFDITIQRSLARTEPLP